MAGSWRFRGAFRHCCQHGSASVDAVAESSAVSKQTVYNHFGDKKTLFGELLTRDMASADVDIDETAMRVGSSGNPERDLVEFARVYLRSILQSHLVRMRQLGRASCRDRGDAWN